MNEINKESKSNGTANGKEVSSSDLLESIVDVEELKPGGVLLKELHKIVKKYGIEYQLVVGAKDLTWSSSYEGKEKIINQLKNSSLGYIFLVRQNVLHPPYKK